jgi:lysophospholipase L1-like esterase
VRATRTGSQLFALCLLLTSTATSAGPRGEPVPAATLEDPCLDAGCKRRALDPFRAALARHRAGKADRALRISYFGDSLTASDHVPDGLRVQLGAVIGAGGPGFVWAAEPHPYCQQRAVTLSTTGSWQVHGVSTTAPPDRLLGLGGSAEGSGVVRWVPKANVASIDVHYLEQPRGGTFTITAGGTPVAEVATAGERKRAAFHRVALPAGPGKPAAIELRARGRVRVFGAALEAARGVVVDNLGVVNATAKGMVRYNLAAHLEGQLAHRASDLVIVMFGTNEAEWLTPRGAGMAEHEQVMTELLGTVRAANPTASCLVVSPLDQIDWRDPKTPPRASVPAMVEAQRRAATARGCAFWDVYAWMGGKGSSATWFKRGLVTKDFQHPTVAGAKRLADALAAGLLASSP